MDVDMGEFIKCPKKHYICDENEMYNDTQVEYSNGATDRIWCSEKWMFMNDIDMSVWCRKYTSWLNNLNFHGNV